MGASLSGTHRVGQDPYATSPLATTNGAERSAWCATWSPASTLIDLGAVEDSPAGARSSGPSTAGCGLKPDEAFGSAGAGQLDKRPRVSQRRPAHKSLLRREHRRLSAALETELAKDCADV